MQRPFAQSYWVIPGLFCAGHYPGDLHPATRDAKLAALVAAGIRRVINLIPEHETGRNGQAFDHYAPVLDRLARSAGTRVECLRLGYADGSTPPPSQMINILDTIDASIAADEGVYIHCWGGHGRTGTTVACYLIRHGHTPQAAIDQVVAWRAPLPQHHYPFEGQQEAFVRGWPMHEAAHTP